MEALRDRTVKIDVPYVTRLRDEIKIYEKDFNAEQVRGKHIAPHTHRDRRHVGGPDPAGAAQARQPDAAAEAEAVQRQDAARLHRGQRHRAEARRPRTRACTASARATSRTRSPTPWSPTPTRTASTRSWCCNELEAGLRHHSLITNEEQLQALQGAARASSRRSTRTSSRTRCSGPSPPTRTP